MNDKVKVVTKPTAELEGRVMAVPLCTKESDHRFGSSGQCEKCGGHRAPAVPVL